MPGPVFFNTEGTEEAQRTQSRLTLADGTQLALNHDAFGRMSSVTRLGADPAIDPGLTLGRYVYDGFGRRVARFALVGAHDSSTDTSATDIATESPSGNENAKGAKANAVLKGLRKELTEKLAAKGNTQAADGVNAALSNGIEATGGEGDSGITVEVWEHVHYGPGGLRLSDTSMTGAVRLERIWHPDTGQLIAVIDETGQVHAMHNDHLGAPQVASTGATNTWTGATTPFGGTVAEYGTLALPDRLPGQYADGEAGYRYNMFRDYDPTTGRYLQSDPIGLAGGLNTYAYVDGNPVNAVDPLGLMTKCFPGKSCYRSSTEGAIGRIGGGGWGGGKFRARGRATKSVNLPSWKKVKIDVDHIASRHLKGGSYATPRRTLFPEYVTKENLSKFVRDAYRNCKKVGRQGQTVRLRSEVGGVKIEMYLNLNTKTIETAYPLR